MNKSIIPKEQLTLPIIGTWKMYELRHPITKETRYIGITRHSLETRLEGHLNDFAKGYQYGSAKYRWIKELVVHGLLPEISQVMDIGTFDRREAECVESERINHLIVNGHRLVNVKRKINLAS